MTLISPPVTRPAARFKPAPLDCQHNAPRRRKQEREIMGDFSCMGLSFTTLECASKYSIVEYLTCGGDACRDEVNCTLELTTLEIFELILSDRWARRVDNDAITLGVFSGHRKPQSIDEDTLKNLIDDARQELRSAPIQVTLELLGAAAGWSVGLGLEVQDSSPDHAVIVATYATDLDELVALVETSGARVLDIEWESIER